MTQPPANSTDVELPTAPPADLGGRSFGRRLGAIKQRLAANAGVPFRAIFGSRAKGTFGILMYHRVTPVVKGVAPPTWNVTPERLRSQLHGLLRRGFTPLPLRTVLGHRLSGDTLPERSFVVTFDDGYENNYTHAFPILRELNVPATIFLATAYLDSVEPFPSDDWSAKGSPAVPTSAWRPLTTEQCRMLDASPLIELGAHTHTHDDFRNRPDDLKRDLLTCRNELYSRFGISDCTFAFPYGTRSLGFSGPLLADAAQDAGMLCSLTTESELVRLEDDPFDWGRFTAEGHDTAATLAAKLDGWFSLARVLWRKLRRAHRTETQHTAG